MIVEPVRRVRFDGPNRFTAIPVSGIPSYGGINVVGERVG